MAGPWVIEVPNQAHSRYSCFARLSKMAKKYAMQLRQPVQVRYQGPRDRPTTNQLSEVDWLMHPNGSREINDPRYHP